LRALRSRSELPRHLDLDRIAEEVADLGSAELNTVRSFIRQIFVHLIKAASDPKADAVARWADEVDAFHADIVDRYAPSMRRHIDIQSLWRRAHRQAGESLRRFERPLFAGLPVECPFALDEIVGDDFSFDVALARLRSIGR
jgi:hypothetical protein